MCYSNTINIFRLILASLHSDCMEENYIKRSKWIRTTNERTNETFILSFWLQQIFKIWFIYKVYIYFLKSPQIWFMYTVHIYFTNFYRYDSYTKYIFILQIFTDMIHIQSTFFYKYRRGNEWSGSEKWREEKCPGLIIGAGGKLSGSQNCGFDCCPGLSTRTYCVFF